MDCISSLSFRRDSLYDCPHIEGKRGDPHILSVTFSGGGAAGLSFAGVISQLEAKYNHEIKYWIGSSVGGAMAMFAAMKVPPEELEACLCALDPSVFLDSGGERMDLFNPFTSWNTYRYGIPEFISKYGFARGNKMGMWLRECVSRFGYDPDLTFSNLYDQTGNHLVVTSTSLNTCETLYLSRSSYPHLKVLDVVQSSMVYPFLFQPSYIIDSGVSQGKRMMLDGGALDNIPIGTMDLLDTNGEVLGYNRKSVAFAFLPERKEYYEVDNIIKYTYAFISCLHTHLHSIQTRQPYFQNRVASIDSAGVTTLDFKISGEKIKTCIEAGKVTAREFLERREEMIRTKGPLPRNLFIPNDHLRLMGYSYLPNSMIEETILYQTNPHYKERGIQLSNDFIHSQDHQQ